MRRDCQTLLCTLLPVLLSVLSLGPKSAASLAGVSPHFHENSTNLSPDWLLAGIRNVQFEIIDNATWARSSDSTLGGDILVQGRDNLQPSFEACARSCRATDMCIGFNWCDEGPCPMNASGQEVQQYACELLHSQPAEEGRGVVELAHGNTHLGVSGMLMIIDRPEPDAFPNYEVFPWQGLQDMYDMPCDGSFFWSECILPGPVLDLVARCDGWADCQGVVVGPLGWGSRRMLYGMLKGSNTTGEFIDPMKGTLNTATYLLVKKSALASAAAAAADGEATGLSAGAIAGIVSGATVVSVGLVLGAFLVLCHRRRQLGSTQEIRFSGGSRHSNSSGEDVATIWGKMGEGSHKGLVARLLAEAPSPQWAHVIVERGQIQLASKNGKAIRLGAGASGSVYRGILQGATPCAVKVFDFDADASLPMLFIQEATVLRCVVNPYIVQFLGVCVTEDRGLLIMELMAGGDLGKALREDAEEAAASKRERQYAWHNKGRRTALQVAAGLQYLHHRNILHMDLKSHNVLLARDGTAKIGDVGFSRMLQTSHISGLGGRMGTWNWCAPEIILGGRASDKSDIYSFGLLLWEIAVGATPQRGFVYPLEVPEHCPPEIAELQARCIRQDPAERPSAAEVVQILKASMQLHTGLRPSLDGGPAELRPSPGSGTSTAPSTVRSSAPAEEEGQQLSGPAAAGSAASCSGPSVVLVGADTDLGKAAPGSIASRQPPSPKATTEQQHIGNHTTRMDSGEPSSATAPGVDCAPGTADNASANQQRGAVLACFSGVSPFEAARAGTVQQVTLPLPLTASPFDAWRVPTEAAVHTLAPDSHPSIASHPSLYLYLDAGI